MFELNIIPLSPTSSLLRKAIFDTSIEVVIGMLVAWIVGKVEVFYLNQAKSVVIWQHVRNHNLVDGRGSGFGVSADVEILWIMDKQAVHKVGFKTDSDEVVELISANSEHPGNLKGVLATGIIVGEIFSPNRVQWF